MNLYLLVTHLQITINACARVRAREGMVVVPLRSEAARSWWGRGVGPIFKGRGSSPQPLGVGWGVVIFAENVIFGENCVVGWGRGVVIFAENVIFGGIWVVWVGGWCGVGCVCGEGWGSGYICRKCEICAYICKIGRVFAQKSCIMCVYLQNS